MWKPRMLTIQNTYTQICKLNQQLLSYPNQTGLLPEDKLKSAFISLCLPDWQQEFFKTDINEYSSSWPVILAKAEALEQAEAAITEYAPAKDDKRNREEGEIPNSKQPAKKKAKTNFYCKMHGPDQRHNTDGCKVINAEIERLKGRKPSFTNNNQQGPSAGNAFKKPWSESKKRPAASYSIEQLKEVVKMTQKKATEDAQKKFNAQVQDEIHVMQNDNQNLREKKLYNDAILELDKMREMEVYINNPIESGSDTDSGDKELTQAELDELAASFSD